MLRFRKLKESDLSKTDWSAEPLTALLPAGADYIPQHLAAGDTIFVIFEEGKPIGLLEMDAQTVGEKPRCAVIGYAVILPDCRRRGLGRMLMTLAAGEAVERQIWFLAGSVPQEETAQRFADAVHFRMTEWFETLRVLDLSDVEGLRYGNRQHT